MRGSQSWKATKPSRRNHETEEVARFLQERPDRHRPLPRGDADQGGGRQVQVLHFPPRPSRQLPLKCLPGWGQAKISKISKLLNSFSLKFLGQDSSTIDQRIWVRWSWQCHLSSSFQNRQRARHTGSYSRSHFVDLRLRSFLQNVLFSPGVSNKNRPLHC